MSSAIFESSVCHVCKKICLNNSIFCDLCHTWVHGKCVKLTQHQLRLYSAKPDPYFCPKCISSLIPFSNVTNAHIDQFNSLNPHSRPAAENCSCCLKPINHNELIECKLGKHFLHKKCSNEDLKSINRSLWSCNNCKRFPFNCLNDDQITSEFVDPNHTAPAKRAAKIKLNRKINELATTLPKITLADPSNHDNEININFKYYEFNEFNKMSSKVNQANHMTLFHSNIRSYHKNFDEIAALVSNMSLQFDVIGLTETWDSPKKPIDPQDLAGYHPLEKVEGSSQNGGVVAYVKNTINYSRRKDLENELNPGKNGLECESLFLETESTETNENFVVGVLYRHPNGKTKYFSEKLEKVLSKIGKENKKVVIMGDLNIDIIKVGKHRETDDFLNLMFENCLFPYITYPTRFDKDLKATLIDNIYYNYVSEELISGNLISHVSDHLPNFIIIPTVKIKAPATKTYKRNFESFDIESFRQDLIDTNLANKLQQMKDPSKMYDFFHSTLSFLLDMHSPVKPISRKKKRKLQKPWITEIIVSKISEKNSLYGQFLKSGDREILNEYKALRNSLNHDIRKSKFYYQRQRFESFKNDSKKMWKEVNSLLARSNSQSFPQIMQYGRKRLSSRKEISLSFNEHFSTVAPNLVKKLKKGNDPLLGLKSQNQSMYFTPTDPYEIHNLLMKLNPNKAIDIYKFPIKVTKEIAHIISAPLSIIINKSVTQGIFPDRLKIARVSPIFKGGDKHEIINYRPISILPLFDKVFEQVVNSRLKKFLLQHEILSQNQFGFQEDKSTADAVLKLTDEINSSIKKKETCCTILLDLAKAFDTVDHTVLIRKLDALGIRGPLNNWFKSYLSNRKQIVSIESEMSPPKKVEYGVPQGSVLGPTLFLMYINDLPSSTTQFKYTLFADDTSLFMSHKDPKTLEETVNNELSSVSEWLINNRLSLNINKSCFILFSGGKKTQSFRIFLLGNEVKRVSSAKYLGVMLDENLDWQPHVNYIVTKLKQGSGFIRKLSHLISAKNLTTLYYSFIQSHVQYCITSWGSPNTKGLIQLDNIISNIVNKINKIHQCNNITPLKVLKINSLYKLGCGKLIYKFHYNQTPMSLSHLFRKPTHNRHTRQTKSNALATLHFDQAPSPIRFYGPQIWNQYCLKSSTSSFSSFVRNLKAKLLDV